MQFDILTRISAKQHSELQYMLLAAAFDALDLRPSGLQGGPSHAAVAGCQDWRSQQSQYAQPAARSHCHENQIFPPEAYHGSPTAVKSCESHSHQPALTKLISRKTCCSTSLGPNQKPHVLPPTSTAHIMYADCFVRQQETQRTACLSGRAKFSESSTPEPQSFLSLSMDVR